MTGTSLWGEEFDIPSTPQVAKKISKKISEPKEIKKTISKPRKTDNDVEYIKLRIKMIETEVYRILGKYVSNTVTIRTKKDLHAYIDACIKNGDISIDTETNNSLDPITCKLMGPCIYTPGQKNAYIPINHVNIDTKQRLDNQLTEEDIKEEFSRLTDTAIIMHNGKFDYQVVKCTTSTQLKIYWDTMIAAKLLDENERAGLKEQYISKIDPTIEKYSISQLFEDIPYEYFPPELFALYAATDAYMTYKLYQYQKEIFERKENEKLYKLFKEIEMPLVEVLAEMELTGMAVDQDYAKLLSKKYHDKLDIIDKKLYEELDKLKPQIDTWRTTEEANYHPPKKTGQGEGKSKNEQLDDPIKLSSPTQLAILFYDVLKCSSVNKKAPRGTGEDELKALADKYKLDFCKILLERREIVKLLTTYIDVIPELSNRWPDKRVRTHFNQYGAATGRLSSSDPVNFQNIPAANKEIRMLFKAGDGNLIIGSDYSAQEPRLTAHYSQDKSMITAYEERKDLYSVIASMSFDRKYEDCLEFYPEGTKIYHDGKEVICGYKTHQNKEGKKYRSMAKSILLG